MSMTNSQTRSGHDGPEMHAGVRDKAHGAAWAAFTCHLV
jgi:hypothetical protein